MLNEKIIEKLKVKTADDPAMQKYLLKLIEFELENKKWYDKEYNKFLEDTCPEGWK